MRLFISIFIISIFSGLSSAQETTIVSLTVSQDVLINSQNVQEDLDFLAFGTSGEEQKNRSLIKFDLENLPYGKLKHATLSLTMANEGNGVISLHKVTENWKGSFYDDTNYANWQSTGIENVNWNENGGDFLSIPSGRAVFNDNETLDIFGPRMKLDIQDWIENPSTNNGWLILGSENTIDSKTQFYSGKNLTQGPILTLIYELPDTCYATGGQASSTGNQTVIARCPDQDNLNINLKVTEAQGENMIWLICSNEGDILGFSINTSLDLSGYPQDLNIYHLSFNSEVLGASVGNNIRNLVGCFDLSNKIEITDNTINGGEISTTSEDTEVTICPLYSEDIDNLQVTNKIGVSSAWAVLDNEGFIEIIGAQKPYTIQDLPEGSYEIRHLSYQGEPVGLFVGNHIDDISGCYAWSNSIDVTLLDIEECRPSCSLIGSNILGEVMEICPASTIGASFNMDSLVMSRNHGPFAIWILTDRRGNTLEAIPDVGLSNYQVAKDEIVYLFHITYNDLIFQFRNNIYDLNGCYGISNALLVKGVYEDGCPLVCDLPSPTISSDLSDDVIDLCRVSTIEDLDLISNMDNTFPSQFIVRNDEGRIISIGDHTMELEFETNGLYNLSQVIAYEDSAFLNIEDKIEKENTCYSFSNEILLEQIPCPFICEAPENFRITESALGNVSIQWDRIEGATRYEFEIGFDADTSNLTMLVTSRNWIRISNPSNRSLIFRLRSNCGSEGMSDYSEFVQFTSNPNSIANSRSFETQVLTKEINLSPNPASDRMLLEFDTNDQTTNVEIYDAIGRLRYQNELDTQTNKHVLDISTLELGVHILQLKSKKGLQGQKRFIKIR